MSFYLRAFFDLFRFIKRYRERQLAQQQREAAERAREREHQFQIIDSIATKLIDFAKTNQEGLIELAKASNAQAAVFQTWIDGFKPISSDPIPSSRVSEQDEYEREEQALMSELSAIHPDFALALKLNELDKDPNPGFDREGRDIN